ncbi:MAG: hypothetical protein H6765_06315 [Candidatus Peribacteria bacterium]|nr:MAG: hypothetical protein H6765_06315 [Candidatus Peribacteria bacterium]
MPERTEQKRIKKTPQELATIREAIAITEQVYAWVEQHIQQFVGRPERELRVALLSKAVELGAERESLSRYRSKWGKLRHPTPCEWPDAN